MTNLRSQDNPKAVALLVYRLLRVSYRYAIPTLTYREQHNAAKAILGYEEDEVIEVGYGSYSYPVLYYVVCAQCNSVHRNNLLSHQAVSPACCSCHGATGLVNALSTNGPNLAQSVLLTLPMPVIDELNFLLANLYRHQEFGELSVDSRGVPLLS